MRTVLLCKPPTRHQSNNQFWFHARYAGYNDKVFACYVFFHLQLHLGVSPG